MLSLLIGLFILSCSVWVLFDSHKKGARNPAGWAFFVALFWIGAFPLYLYKRNKIVPIDEEHAPSPSNRWIGLIASVLLIGGFMVKNVIADSVPACDAPEVVQVLSGLLNGMTIGNPVQRPESDQFGDVRLCNSTIAGRIIPYNVRWYSNDRDQFSVSVE
jgi:hypothetical protein